MMNSPAQGGRCQPKGQKVVRIVFSFDGGDHDAWRRRLGTARFSGW
jgi:hypothetical protein